MNLFRGIIALGLFIAGIFFTIKFFVSGYDGFIAALAILMFISAYIIWPSKKRGGRDDGYWWADALEILIELPFDIMIWLFRLIIRLFKHGDGGIDL